MTARDLIDAGIAADLGTTVATLRANRLPSRRFIADEFDSDSECPTCDGTGLGMTEESRCFTCTGSGNQPWPTNYFDGSQEP